MSDLFEIIPELKYEYDYYNEDVSLETATQDSINEY